jgi:soluble lytic murein transglycosylase-like protein
MLRVRPFGAFFLAAAGVFGAPALAADADPCVARPEYLLTLANPGAFRLSASRESDPRTHQASASAQVAARPFARQIEQAARDAGLDPVLVHAVIRTESRYNPVAKSPKGALGLMQVLPETAARYGLAHALLSIEDNLKAGTRYLHDLMELFENRLDLALAAYNAGENAVLRHGNRIPPYRETLQYVPAVLDRYREWREPDPAVRAEPSRFEYLPGTLFGSARVPGGTAPP